ncbi:MAG: sulfur transferase domain-containing protein [Gammaproteobacteria bacterium]|nr:sulfur transferase domain-containing protein [Gammaproteobacteria bacterium]
MQIKRLDDAMSVCAQISADDVAEIARHGFRSIICNRPDGEGSDQPLYEEIHRSAGKHGLEARYLPVKSGKVRDEDARAFAHEMEDLPKPELVD